MRNLLPIQRRCLPISSREAPGLPLTASTWDASSDDVICVFGPSSEFPTIEVARVSYSGTQKDIATWESSPSELTGADDSVLDVHYFSDSGTVCVVLSNGNIVVVDENGGTTEIVGSVDEGITAASWSPDEEILALSTAASTFLLMTREFDGISDVALNPEDVKASKHVNVGWGKKETQFQGKRAKAMRDPTVPEHVDEGVLSSHDNGKVTISWRGDGQYVAICTKEESPSRRLIRVYTRDGQLDSASEPVDGLEGVLSWRPSGNLIAGIQRLKDRIDVVFFERNGLRHGEFTLPIAPEDIESENIRQLYWNPDSTVLAICYDDRAQLWTMGNYHYYLKQEILYNTQNTPKIAEGTCNIVSWHPEKPLKLAVLLHDKVDLHDYALGVSRGTSKTPTDAGAVAVVDGKTLKLTPIKIGNVPPPMALCDLPLPSAPLDVTISKNSNKVAVLTTKGVDIVDWDLTSRKTAQAAKISDTSVVLSDGMLNRRLVGFTADDEICVLSDEEDGSCTLSIYSNEGSKEGTPLDAISVPGVLSFPASISEATFFVQTRDGKVLEILKESSGYATKEVGSLPSACPHVETIQFAERTLVCGLTDNGRLYANSQLIASNCSSFQLTESYLIFTTTQHFLKFVHIGADIYELDVPQDDPAGDERCRSIERGARIVQIIPSALSVVLQMPRGNLETIYPRALVLAGVRKSIEGMDYKSAFLACRAHRVDMNIIHDHAPTQFLENVPEIIRQLGKAEFIDLFLSQIREEDVSTTIYKETLPSSQAQSKTVQTGPAPKGARSKVNLICDAFTSVLSADITANLQNIITAYVSKAPPDHSSALRLVSKLRETNTAAAERAVEHVCWLSDVNRLYENALGLYDLPLTLMIAEQSQKDPREYLPYIQSLGEMEDLRMKFTIDNDLKRHEKALQHLHDMGEEAFDELLSYTVSHELYQDALELFKYDDKKQKMVLAKYAVYLDNSSRFVDAGIAYESLQDYEPASEAYRRAGLWRESLYCATAGKTSESALDYLCSDLIEALLESKDYQAAAAIYTDYKKDTTEAAKVLCKGSWFADAMRILTLVPERETLLESVVDSGLMESFGQTTELVADCKAQVKAQTTRLWELRKKKAEDPLAYFEGGDDVDAPDNVSLANTAATTNASLFTRYTAKTGTAVTGTTQRTSRNRRREERKRARGKKGSIYEEEYLVNSIGRLIERLQTVRPETERLVHGLLRRGMRQQAKIIENGMKEVWDMILEVEEDVWSEAWLTEETEEGTKRTKPVLKPFEALTML